MVTAHFYQTPQFKQQLFETINWMTRWRLPIRFFLLTPMHTEADVIKQLALQGLGQKIQLVDTEWTNKFAQLAEVIFCAMATAKQYTAYKEAWADFHAMICQEEAIRTAVTSRVALELDEQRASWQKIYDSYNKKAIVIFNLAFQTFLLGFCCLSIVEAFSSTDENKRFFRSQLPSNIYYVLSEAQNSKEEIRAALSLVGMEGKTEAVHLGIQAAMRADVWLQKVGDVVGKQAICIANKLWHNIKGLHITQILMQ